MAQVHLKVLLSSNRNQSGILQLLRENALLTEYEALGRGSQGAGDTQMQVKGNTPTGEYRATQVVSTAQWPQNSYGPHGAIRLQPVSGNARAAEQQVGRQGLLVHGGSPGGAGYWRKQPQQSDLKATLGCIRLSNDNMADLVRRLFQETLEPQNNRSVDLDVKVTVTDHEASFVRP